MEPIPKDGTTEYVNSEDFRVKSELSEIQLNRNGEEAVALEEVFAKVLSDQKSAREAYYVLEVNGNLHDPIGPYSNRGSRLDSSKFAKVSKEVFDLYIGYLKTSNSVYLTKAQRGFLNG